MKQQLLLKIKERVKKGRDTEQGSRVARKEVWKAGIRRWRGKWGQRN